MLARPAGLGGARHVAEGDLGNMEVGAAGDGAKQEGLGSAGRRVARAIDAELDGVAASDLEFGRFAGARAGQPFASPSMKCPRHSSTVPPRATTPAKR